MSFLGGGPGGAPDTGPEVSPVSTPDQKKLGHDHGQGLKESGIMGHLWAVLFCSLIAGLEIIINALVGVFDEILALFVGLVTAAQGTNTPGFYRLTAKILNDLLGVDVAGSELEAAARTGGLIGGMKQTGADFFNVLLNELLGKQPSIHGGPAGLPGSPGTPLTPDQGLTGAAAFLGFILSFAVRQGNLETISTALPESFRMFEGIRSYGELMAKNLGLGRLSRRVLTPILQETVVGPMQRKLNQQYRPANLDTKQIASAHIRGDFDNSDFSNRLAMLGYTDDDIVVLLRDTYTRLSVGELFTLHETGNLSDSDNLKAMQALGYNTFDVPLFRQARALELVRTIDRAYIVTAITDLHHGLIDLATFTADVDATILTPEEKAAYKRNGANRAAARGRLLSINFLKKAYLNSSITLGEYLAHAAELGYEQSDIDILEQELLVEQKAEAAKIKAQATKIAARAQTAAAKKAAIIAAAEKAEGG